MEFLFLANSIRKSLERGWRIYSFLQGKHWAVELHSARWMEKRAHLGYIVGVRALWQSPHLSRLLLVVMIVVAVSHCCLC